MSLEDLRDEVGSLLEKYREALGADSEMPLVGDWMLIVVTDTAGDPDSSSYSKVVSRGQAFHISLGLLEATRQRLLSEQ